jgi:hypothetical protein
LPPSGPIQSRATVKKKHLLFMLINGTTTSKGTACLTRASGTNTAGAAAQVRHSMAAQLDGEHSSMARSERAGLEEASARATLPPLRYRPSHFLAVRAMTPWARAAYATFRPCTHLKSVHENKSACLWVFIWIGPRVDWMFGGFQSLKLNPNEHRIQLIEASQLDSRHKASPAEASA